MYHIDISKKNISDIFGISDVTIAKTYRKIYTFHKIIMHNKVTEAVLEKRNNISKSQLFLTEDELIVTDKSDITTSESNSTSEIADDINHLII
jgi:hypothetical protein